MEKDLAGISPSDASTRKPHAPLLGKHKDPSPDPGDHPCDDLSSDTGSNESGAKLDTRKTAQKGSLVVTTKPYVSPSSPQTVRKMNWKNRKTSTIEVLPGLFENNSFEKYLTFGIENTNVNDVDIFELHREIVRCIGRVPKISNQGNGTLLIEAASPEESAKLKALDHFQGAKASCTPHTTLNQCKGVIYSYDLLKFSEEKLLHEFKDQKVIAVRRMHRKTNDSLIPQPLLILTFDLLRPPTIILAAWHKLRVRPFIPSPMRCFYCQKFGHTNKSFRRRLGNK